jgi:hypothetical protein
MVAEHPGRGRQRYDADERERPQLRHELASTKLEVT